MQKVFISYSHKDEDWKNRLQTQLAVLENQGLLSVWEDRKIAGGDDWYPEIERAIESAHVAILLISADFLSSKFILGNEIPPLLERRKIAGLRVIPLILKPCPWKTVEWLSKIQGRPIDNKPLSGFDEHHQDHHLSELALEINKLIQPLPSIVKSQTKEVTDTPSTQSKASYDPCNSAFLVPFRAKGKFMVGRDIALKKVRQQLLEGKPTSIGQTALFQGIGGLGKTQLAVEYAHNYRGEYHNGVYWITADENIDAQLTQIAVAARWVALESEHAIKLDVARHRLKTYSNCLIIFDNLESMDSIRDYLPDSSSSPHILVTSRSEQPEFTDVKLDLLDENQSYSLLVQEANTKPKNEEEEFAAHEVAAILCGLPLALELAGAFLEHRPIGWCAYLDLLREDLKQALPSKLASLTKHEADLFKTLKVSEREIGEEPLLGDVLDLLTWSGSSPMSLHLMAHLLGKQSTQLYRALGLGVALRLLQKVPDSERYAVHRLVQEVRRQDQPLAPRKDWANKIALNLGDWFEAIRRDFRELPLFELELEHLRAWQINADFFSTVSSVRLLWLQAYPAYHRGRYTESLQILQRAIEQYDLEKLSSSALKANLLNDISSILINYGSLTESLRCAQEALRIRRDSFGEKHSDIAMSLHNLAGIYARIDNYVLARDLGNEALNMRQDLHGANHSDIAATLSHLAICNAKLGDHPHALKLGIRAIEMLRDLLGDKHPAVASALNDFGNVNLILGDKHNCIDFCRQALEIRRELLGGKHPETAMSLQNLALSYSKFHEYQRALEVGKQALEMRRELLGESHLETISSLRFVIKQLRLSPFTARQGVDLGTEYLKNVPRDHVSHATVLSILENVNGFRMARKGGQKKRNKK